MPARGALGWLLPVVVASGCRRAEAPRAIVLVTVDTLRASHLGLYGYGRPTSPFVDSLAAESTVFEAAVPTCPATGPSLASLLTGTHRASHGVHRNGSVLRPEVLTLAETLRAAGYRTAARVGNAVVGHRSGFAQGFDEFLADAGPSDGQAVLRDARRLLDGFGEARFFLWPHFMDPHGPYLPPKAYEALFAPSGYRWPGEADLPLSSSNYGMHVIPRYQAVDARRAPADYRARYDAEIRYTADHAKAVVAELRARGLWDRTLFVLTADHGESLGEHGYYFQHGFFAYEDCLGVPLLMRAPGLVPAGRRVPASVSLIDVAPTVLELARLPPAAGMEGRSLGPLLHGRGGDRAAFAQTYYGSEQVALRVGRRKYIFTLPARSGQRSPARTPAWLLAPAEGRHELFDLAADPGETQDLAGAEPELLADLQGQTLRWLAEQGRRRPEGASSPAPAPDPVLEKQLRALGYYRLTASARPARVSRPMTVERRPSPAGRGQAIGCERPRKAERIIRCRPHSGPAPGSAGPPTRPRPSRTRWPAPP